MHKQAKAQQAKVDEVGRNKLKVDLLGKDERFVKSIKQNDNSNSFGKPSRVVHSFGTFADLGIVFYKNYFFRKRNQRVGRTLSQLIKKKWNKHQKQSDAA